MEIESPTLLSRGFFPDNTELQEHILVTERDIVVGDRCQIEYGLTGECVAVCEFSRIRGNVTAHGELRIDNFCQVQGDVTAEDDAFLGEGVHVQGKLTVYGDMDIGDNVKIDRGFEAKGWIVIRNPMPVIVYLLLYLMALLKYEREEDLEKFLGEVTAADAEDSTPLLIPARTHLSMEELNFQAPLVIGAHNRLHGTIRAESIEVGEHTTIFGSLRTPGKVRVGAHTTVHGEVVSGEAVQVDRGAVIMGNVYAPTLELHEEARVDGLIKAPEGLRIVRV
ncbi:MAG: polymer-forming cytoskeletal protein [Methanomicrobiales archaeon]|nr:polymer-forming cytoskeletal protein [Methanomicrobiales archaeon]